MKFLIVLLAAAGSLAQGDAVFNAWLKKHGLSEYADELEELGAESREDLDYLEEGGASTIIRRMCCQLATAVATLPCTHECVRADAISVLMR